jgi:hypothetical protein
MTEVFAYVARESSEMIGLPSSSAWNLLASKIATRSLMSVKFLASERGDDVIVIHATQHYICFLQFNITGEYLRDFVSSLLPNA